MKASRLEFKDSDGILISYRHKHACVYEDEVLRRGTYVIEAKQLYCLLPSNTQKHHRILLKVGVSCNTFVHQTIELC